MDNLTAKQEEILTYIRDYILKKNFPPTVREICTAVNLRSTSSVYAQLETLERKGFIRRDDQKSRAIEIIDQEFAPTRREIANIPEVGRVAAGQPIYAEQNIVDYIPMPIDYLPNEETFFLRVKGDSMINVGIYDGDRILCEQCSSAKNGDIVVALVGEEATVKRFYKEGDHIRLQPENDSMDPIIVPDCTVCGKVIGLIRMLR